MAKKMLIDAIHDEEVRVAIIDGDRLEEYDAESFSKRPIKGNVYLAKVLRIEPSLQAAFVDYGGNKNGFLPFSEIHPDYYNIPVSDRVRIEAPDEDDESLVESDMDGDNLESKEDPQTTDMFDENTLNFVEDLAGVSFNKMATPSDELSLQSADSSINEDFIRTSINDLEPSTTISVDFDENIVENKNTQKNKKQKSPRPYKYKIQEVIKRRQILLVQVTKEERGNKGAALTTYLSLPGRYCVLMPNAGQRSGGISRKISDSDDRQRLKDILGDLEIPAEMGTIIRTAGENRTKIEIKRDFEYLLKLWSDIRDKTLKSIAPELICAEGDLVKRAIRDMYTREIDEIIIEGETQYKNARTFMKELLPSHARKIKLYKDAKLPLFTKWKIQNQVEEMMNPVVNLPSGGALVINVTEALIAIDVNSGKSTRERNIDETALKTNLEAATEIARQMRLRDLAGIVVIDFIDMSDQKYIQQVEKRLRDAMRFDRARTQVGRIGLFGLLTLSRQRLRPNILETNTTQCSHCKGTGVVRSIESTALHIMRAIEDKALQGGYRELVIYAPKGADLYLLNQKRKRLSEIEDQFGVKLTIIPDRTLVSPDFHIEPVVDYARLGDGIVQIPASYVEDHTFRENKKSESHLSIADVEKHQSKDNEKSHKQKSFDGKKQFKPNTQKNNNHPKHRHDRQETEQSQPIQSQGEDIKQKDLREVGIEGDSKSVPMQTHEGKDTQTDQNPRKMGRRLHRRRNKNQHNRFRRNDNENQEDSTRSGESQSFKQGQERSESIPLQVNVQADVIKIDAPKSAVVKPNNPANKASTQESDSETGSKKKSAGPKKWWKRILDVNS